MASQTKNKNVLLFWTKTGNRGYHCSPLPLNGRTRTTTLIFPPPAGAMIASFDVRGPQLVPATRPSSPFQGYCIMRLRERKCRTLSFFLPLCRSLGRVVPGFLGVGLDPESVDEQCCCPTQRALVSHQAERTMLMFSGDAVFRFVTVTTASGDAVRRPVCSEATTMTTREPMYGE